MRTRTGELTIRELDELSAIVKQATGINLHRGKRELVRERLSRRMRSLNIKTFRDYYEYLTANLDLEFCRVVDALTTNVTGFFREPMQIDYFSQVALAERCKQNRNVRIWSAGCSSGEEPYSIAISCLENHDPHAWDVRILATDLSGRILERAKRGIYKREALQNLTGVYREKYFEPVEKGPKECYRIRPQVKKRVMFARLNLIRPWPMTILFDVIFCRNVMIYFEASTQSELIQRFWDRLIPGGYLFIGQAESLANVRHSFEFVRPSVYRKPATRT